MGQSQGMVIVASPEAAARYKQMREEQRSQMAIPAQDPGPTGPGFLSNLMDDKWEPDKWYDMAEMGFSNADPWELLWNPAVSALGLNDWSTSRSWKPSIASHSPIAGALGGETITPEGLLPWLSYLGGAAGGFLAGGGKEGAKAALSFAPARRAITGLLPQGVGGRGARRAIGGGAGSVLPSAGEPGMLMSRLGFTGEGADIARTGGLSLRPGRRAGTEAAAGATPVASHGLESTIESAPTFNPAEWVPGQQPGSLRRVGAKELQEAEKAGTDLFKRDDRTFGDLFDEMEGPYGGPSKTDQAVYGQRSARDLLGLTEEVSPTAGAERAQRDLWDIMDTAANRQPEGFARVREWDDALQGTGDWTAEPPDWHPFGAEGQPQLSPNTRRNAAQILREMAEAGNESGDLYGFLRTEGRLTDPMVDTTGLSTRQAGRLAEGLDVGRAAPKVEATLGTAPGPRGRRTASQAISGRLAEPPTPALVPSHTPVIPGVSEAGRETGQQGMELLGRTINEPGLPEFGIQALLDALRRQGASQTFIEYIETQLRRR